MKILFVLGATSRIRNFDHVIEDLSRRGHTVRLTGRPRKGRFGLPKHFQVDRVTARENPTVRTDRWKDHVEGIRGARDYVRYLAPEFAQATRLVRRAYEISPTEFVLFCERHPAVQRHWKAASRVLALCEALIPSDPGIEGFIREETPDLMVVTPLVTFESYQTDYVKAAHRLGIPIVFLPFSWDNLTNKGLMRVLPDRVMVWNEAQRSEAIDLHGATPETVLVVGAPRFDDFFARTPATTRAEFCDAHGLDAGKPVLLYLGSSQLTGPNEMELVRRWAESIRESASRALRECGILVRPHPALRASWTTVDLSALGNIGVSLDASRGADQELFDSLHHAHAAVGLNTSAMLEAAIVGRPVHTLLIPGFDEGQIGTIHFRYLVEAFGGLVSVARSFEEHHAQVAPLLLEPPAVSPRSRRFAENFLRPRGVSLPVSPILSEEIERAATMRKRPRRVAPVWHYPLRWPLLRWLERHRAQADGGPGRDTSPVATSMSLRPVRTALEELRQETGPVFVGPWLDTPAQELLFWIPFVRWAVRTYGVSPDRLIVVSQSGRREWYGSLARKFLDARELFRGGEFEEGLRRTIPQSQQNPKQAVMYPFDQEILQRAASVMDVLDHQSLHPLMFFRVLQRLKGDLQVHRLPEVLRHERLDAADPGTQAGPPKPYVAVSAAFTEALPERDGNGQLLHTVLSNVAKAHRTLAVEGLDVGALQRVSGATAFVGAFGDLAVLAASCGVPVTAFHSEPLPAEQVTLLRSLGSEGPWGPVTVHHIEESGEFRFQATGVA